MKKILLVLFLLSQAAFAQTITFLEKNDTLQKPAYQEFIFLNDATNIADAVFVARIKSAGSLKKPEKLYEKIKEAAQKIGANTFKFDSFNKNGDGTGELVLSVYYCNNVILGDNFQNISRNKAIVFGDDNLLEQKRQSYKINGEKYEIATGEFKVFPLQNGKDLKISKGGFTGASLWVEGVQGKQSTFLNFSGFGVAGTSYQPAPQGVGVNFTTGKIHNIEPNLALLFMKIFTETK